MHKRSPSTAIPKWLDALGYQADSHAHSLHGVRFSKHQAALRRSNKPHPYRREIDALLNSDSHSHEVVVFDVDEVPTVCFVNAHTTRDAAWLAEVRQKIWNQGLVSLLLVVDEEQLTAYPLSKAGDSVDLDLKQASTTGEFSAQDIQSGSIQSRHPTWFDLEVRVDKALLKSLKDGVLTLWKKEKLPREQAQFLLGQCLFVSYLEHRDIVSDVYRSRRKVGRLHDLIKTCDSKGLERLFKQLKRDFNGDFLDPDVVPTASWATLPPTAYLLLNDFLSRTDIETNQLSLPDWNYDFRYIPVELISGIYETFLDESKSELGAFYTPRHLANLAVDQAFAGSSNICDEVVYDGACGSGILLTTAFRRMICAKELQTGGVLGFEDRRRLLLQSIRASDINQTACRLTAFSLYLSLLEDLEPNDILLLQDNENVTLPTLIHKTILCGNVDGDFFSLAKKKINDCTIFLSNPPWFEAKGKERQTFELWETTQQLKSPLRQIAAAFAHKAIHTVQLDHSRNQGRVCLILPASLITAPSGQPFLKEWLAHAEIERIINFSDSRRLLFSEAIHPCVIAIAKPRSAETLSKISHRERIDYWVPKTDVGMVFGRLTVHGTDKHKISAQEVWRDNQVLRTYLWGSDQDAALIGKLTLLGTVGDLTVGVDSRWIIGKGFHHVDKHAQPKDPDYLKSMRYLSARNMTRDAPVLPNEMLTPFPSEVQTVASFGSSSGAVFRGPRLLFSDGVSSEFELRAIFTNLTFAFKTAIAAICGPQTDENLLRFATLYLRSNLVRYILLHTAYSLTAERPSIKLNVVKTLPFLLPEHHRDPIRAVQIISAVAGITRRWEQTDIFEQAQYASDWKHEAQPLIYEYFGLNERDKVLVQDACEVMIPSVQPSTYGKMRTAYASQPTASDITQYSDWLMKELLRYRKQLGGTGALSIKTTTYRLGSNTATTGQLGIVQIALSKRQTEPSVRQSEVSITKLLEKLKAEQLLPMKAMGDLYLSSDFLVQAGDSLYLIKPLTKRLWLASQALRDAQRIVGAVQ